MSYRPTIARQPEALSQTREAIIENLGQVDLARLENGVIGVTGIGASLAAARIGAAELQRLGRRAFAFFPGEFSRTRGLADAVVGLSHRGRSVETVEVFNDNPQMTRLAFTSDAESPLAKAGDLHLLLKPGGNSTPSATGYTTTLIAMGLAFEKLERAPATDWIGLPEAVADLLAGLGPAIDRAGSQFAGRRAIDCVASAAAFGTADEAALLLREAARIPAAGFETRDYLHGPMESMDADTGVVLFGTGREVKLATDLDAIGVPTLLVTASPAAKNGKNLTVVRVPAYESVAAQAIIDIVIPQLLAATLSDAVGLTDTKFRYRQTDTKIA